MNSKGIQPRVGMQVLKHWCTCWERKKISSISRSGKLRFDNGGSASVEFFKEGYYEIEWIPPTDEERVMFANLAKNALDFGVAFDDVGARFCVREGVDFDDFAKIAESLTLDGMDIDDVSKIEELMR